MDLNNVMSRVPSLLEIIYIMNHEVVSCPMVFFHGHTSRSHFHGQIDENCSFSKPLGPSLGVELNVDQ